MQLISTFNKGFRFLVCVIDFFSKYALVVPLKDKNCVSTVDTFQKILDDSNRKPNKIWLDKRSEFYNSSFKKGLKDNDVEMYSIHNEGESVVAERIIRKLKIKIYKYMTSVSKNVYKEYTPNWSEEIFVISKIKNRVPWTYVITDLNGEEIIGTFYEKELKKTNQKEFRIEKVIKRKGNKLCVRWKGYNDSFNNWIDKKDLV